MISIPTRRSFLVLSVIVLTMVVSLGPLFLTKHASALSGSDFRADRIIDDGVFFDSNTMGTADIQAFLNSKVPNCSQAPCLKDFSEDTTYFPADAYCSAVESARKTAAQIIKDVANACSVSPKVILVLLEKEQSLVTSTAPSGYKYTYATGFCVPDGPPPPACAGTYGFSNQIYYGARQYQKYAKQPNSYTYRAGQVNRINWHPNGGCGTSDVYIQNQATAGLYNYTPYRPNNTALSNIYGSQSDGCSSYGNRNFWRLYNDWFGSPVTSHCFFAPPAASMTGVTFRKANYPRVDQANLVIYSGSSTNCIESHTWNVGVSSWASNVATNEPITSVDRATVQYADLNGDGVDEPILVGYNGTGSGKVEFHVWNAVMNKWQDHIVSDMPANAYSNAKITFADVDGDRRDEPVLVLYSGTGSGKVEFHVLNNDLRTWRWHIASHMPAFSTVDGTITFGDVDGNNIDEPVLILYRNTASTRIEFHTWNQNWQGWRFNTASNQTAIDPSGSFVTFADIDGNNVDEAVLVGLRGTGSGKVEFHTWELGVTAWRYHTASNQDALLN